MKQQRYFREQLCKHGSEAGHQTGPAPNCEACGGIGWTGGHSGSDAYTVDCFCVQRCRGSTLVLDDRLQAIAAALDEPAAPLNAPTKKNDK